MLPLSTGKTPTKMVTTTKSQEPVKTMTADPTPPTSSTIADPEIETVTVSASTVQGYMLMHTTYVKVNKYHAIKNGTRHK